MLIGLAGVILHLDSQFFFERTIRSLTYAAPFAAPLAYTGLGLLLIANRLVDPQSPEWAQWVLLLALGGFAGNFVFSLTDHALNGFFNPLEWLPVVSSAFAVGFLAVPFLMAVTRPLSEVVRGGARRAGGGRRGRLRPPRRRGRAAARRVVVRAGADRRAADGAAAVSQSRGAWR